MDHHHSPAMDHHRPHDFDQFYAESEQIWSGDPNFALVAVVADLAPGRALDVGCGEGADAVWLAARGWQVTALDPSAVAIARARQAAAASGMAVDFIEAGLEEASLPEAFDLVSACYPALAKTADGRAETALRAAVAPGGLLLVVHHADFGQHESRMHGFRPNDYLSPDDIRASLPEQEWRVEVFERRERQISGGGGAHHRDDVVLAARKLV